MRKAQKKQAEDFVGLLEQAHGAIRKAIETDKSYIAMDLLEQCQDGAIGLGELVESSEGQDCRIIPLLEHYCEFVYRVHEEISQGQSVNADKVFKGLRKFFIQIENSLRDDIKVRMEVVFLPYKASMWDSLESVWKAAKEDEACDAYVIPIPYFDKNPDGSFREAHYEGDLYPHYVPVVDYRSYDFTACKPDIIFIHNPYDNYNHVTSVHPFFYSENLKQYTDKLVYIPYFILGEVEPGNEEAEEAIKHFCVTPGVFHADKVIVQSEAMRQAYINVLARETGEKNRGIWEEKICGIGSPKIDKVMNTKKDELEVPEEWLRVIQRPDGSRKKIIFYNTSVSALLTYGEDMLKKMEAVFGVFKENREETALLWRPHPLIKATIESMRPWLWKEYEKIVARYREEGWGIYDDTADMDRAVVLSDAYYGDESSIVRLYQQTEKPIMIQVPQILKPRRYEYDIASAEAICNYQGFYYFVFMQEPALCRMNPETLECKLLYRFYEGERSGRLYRKIIPYQNRLFLVPFLSDQIAVYDIDMKEIHFIRVNENYVDVRWQETLVSSKFEDALVQGKFLYMIPHSYHAIIKMDMERLILEEIPLGRRGTEIFNYCIGSACLQDNKVFFPIYSEGSICTFCTDTDKADRIYPTGNKKKYSNIFAVGDKLWLIPAKLYEGIDIWDMKNKEIEKTLVLNDEINILSHENEAMDTRIGFLIDKNLYLLPFGLSCGVIIDTDSEKANIWNLPNEYEKEKFPLNFQYLFQLRYNSTLLENKKAVICRLRGEWLECKANETRMIERHSIRDKELITALAKKNSDGIISEYDMDLGDFIKIEKGESKIGAEADSGKKIYEYISG